LGILVVGALGSCLGGTGNGLAVEFPEKNPDWTGDELKDEEGLVVVAGFAIVLEEEDIGELCKIVCCGNGGFDKFKFNESIRLLNPDGRFGF